MINLLPIENKKQLRASLHNRILLRYIFILLITAALAAAIMVFMWLTLQKNQEIFKETESKNAQKISSYAELRQKATELSKNINQTKKVLSQRVDYSKVLFELARILPNDVSIASITLESKLFEGNKTLEINLQNPNQASDIKKIFEDSKLFKSVVIDTIINNNRICLARFSVVFNKEGFRL